MVTVSNHDDAEKPDRPSLSHARPEVGNGNVSNPSTEDLVIWLIRAAVRAADGQDDRNAAIESGEPLTPSSKKRSSALSNVIRFGRQLRARGYTGRSQSAVTNTAFQKQRGK